MYYNCPSYPDTFVSQLVLTRIKIRLSRAEEKRLCILNLDFQTVTVSTLFQNTDMDPSKSATLALRQATEAVVVKLGENGEILSENQISVELVHKGDVIKVKGRGVVAVSNGLMLRLHSLCCEISYPVLGIRKNYLIILTFYLYI